MCKILLIPYFILDLVVFLCMLGHFQSWFTGNFLSDCRHGHSAVVTNINYHISKRSEYRLSTEFQPIQLIFPLLSEIAWGKLARHCLKIDYCKLEYNPQVPFNDTRFVIIEIYDERMEEGHTLHAEFCISIDCHIDDHD